MTAHRHRPARPRNRLPRRLVAVPGRADSGRALTLRNETDLLAVVPSSFGFHPEESVVMMALAPDGHPMFARVDLPVTTGQSEAVCAELVKAAVVNHAELAALVAYTDDERAGYLACLRAAAALGAAGCELLVALRADGRRWFRLLPGPEDHEGVPYDLDAHPLTTAAVVEGQVTHGSREALAQTLLPADPEVVEEVARAHHALPPLPVDVEGLRAEARWLDDWVGAHLQRDRAEGVELADLARVVRALAVQPLHEVASVTLCRSNAEQHVRLWTAVVVRCPLDHLAPAAALLALAAWLRGHGALAWCAVDRARQSDPDCRLAALVGEVLEAALPPNGWQPADRRALSLLQD